MKTVRVATWICLACALAACSSSHEKLDLGGTCILNSDCNEPLLCKFGFCHKACVRSVDCDNGGRCVTVDGVAVCQTQAESVCGANQTCATGLVCRTVDNTCRTACSPSNDTSCVAGQTCNGTVCLENRELASTGGDAAVGAVDAGPDLPVAPSDAASANVSLAKPDSVTDAVLAITGASDLGTVTVGAPGTASIFTVTNNGGSDSDAVTILVTDAQFAIGNNLCSGLPLAASKTCTFTVAFVPASVGLKTSVLAVKSGPTVEDQKQIQGTGVAALAPPALSMSPVTLYFGTIAVGTTAGPQTFTVSNTGGTTTGVLAVTKLDSSSSVGGASQFTYTSTCAAALAPGVACVVAVTFAPTISRSSSASITVMDGTVSSPARTVLGIALDRPAISLSGCEKAVTSAKSGVSETFTDTVVGNTSAPLACTLKNDSLSSQETEAITIATTGDFAVAAAASNCTASLAPGLSCSFSLTFGPTAAGQRDGILTVTTANHGAANQLLGGVGI